jgi:hypothetical protein
MTPENLLAPPPSSAPLRRVFLAARSRRKTQHSARSFKVRKRRRVASIRASALAAVLSAVASQSSTLPESPAISRRTWSIMAAAPANVKIATGEILDTPSMAPNRAKARLEN